MADSNQQVVQSATLALTKAIDASNDFAKWIGWEALQNGATVEQAINIVHAIEEGHYSLNDLFNSAQSKVSGTYLTTGINGEPNPTLTVLGQTFDIGQLLGATKVEEWSSGGKNPQYHSREYFTSVDTAAPDGYKPGWDNPNTAPVVSVGKETIDEDGFFTDSVAHYATDANNDALTFSLDAPVAGLTFKSDGSYTFDAKDAAYQHLAAGEPMPVVVNFTVDDGHGGKTSSTLTITVTGTNDAPTVSKAAAVEVEEGGNSVTQDALAGAADVDKGDVLSVILPEGDLPAGVTYDDATHSFTLNPNDGAYDYLAVGESVTVEVAYDVSDGHDDGIVPAGVKWVINGTNDAPVAEAVKADINENGAVIEIKADFADVDTSDTHTVSIDTDETVGKVTSDQKGNFTYNANSQFESLAKGEKAFDTFKYTVDDGNGGTSTDTVTVTITGENDGPVAVADTATGSEDSLIKGNVGANDSDVDDGAVLEYTLNSNVAGLSMGTDGSYTLDTHHAAYQDIHLGETRDVVVNYTVTDEHGASDVSSLTITVAGTADLYHGSVTGRAEKTAHHPNDPTKDVAQTFSFDLNTGLGEGDFSNGKLTVVVTGDIDATNEKADVFDVSSVDFTNFTFSGGSGQADGPDPDFVSRSGFATVSDAALDDGHVDFTVTLSDKIESDNHSVVDVTLTYDYWA